MQLSAEIIISVVSSILTFGAVLMVQLFSNSRTKIRLVHEKESEAKQLAEVKRQEWKNYLIGLMDKLIDARADYEGYLGLSDENQNQERHAIIIGCAVAACIATNDATLVDIATNQLTPYFVDGYKDRNRNAMHEAVIHLANVIKDT